MQIQTQHLVYFSATGNTRNAIRRVGHGLNFPSKEYDITQKSVDSIVELSSTELLVVGVPSFAGRVPYACISCLCNFKGNNTPAIILCTYGNRDYDDTLLELKDLLTANGFHVVAAAACVAQHSIFPELGEDRPGVNDRSELANFVTRSANLLRDIDELGAVRDIYVKGNRPYRDGGVVPMIPSANEQCNSCGTCAHLCPVGAILFENPQSTDETKCISCARCVASCPKCARSFSGEQYEVLREKLIKLHIAPKKNIFYYAE